jgi:Homeodomain-like domain
MANKPAAPLLISDRRLNLLKQHLAKRSASGSEIERIKIIVYGTENLSNVFIAKKLNRDVNTVRRWIKRWPLLAEHLDKFELGIEGGGVNDTELLKEMLIGLKDTCRPGKPVVITDSQKDQIVALACQRPSDHGIPQTTWSFELLAQQAVKMNIVTAVGKSHVHRILKKKTSTS